MNTTDMHIMFRQFAQQMGMQNVRAILPEQIDLLLNTSQDDILDEIIRTNVGITNDRVVTDNSKISQLNALKGIYKVIEIPVCGEYQRETEGKSGTEYISLGKSFEFKTPYYQIGLFRSNNSAENFDGKIFPKYRFLVDFAINYFNNTGTSIKVTDGGISGYEIRSDESDQVETYSKFISNYFPVRLIDDAFLAETQQDYILKARLRTPVITVYNDDTYDLYLGEMKKKSVTADGDIYEEYILDNNLLPYKLRMSYIAIPKRIKYNIDQGTDNEETDMPEQHHVNIVKHAVELFNDSIRGNIATEQAKQQRAQQERFRNQQRNDND